MGGRVSLREYMDLVRVGKKTLKSIFQAGT